MATGNKKIENLTTAEQKTTAAFKMLNSQNKDLKKSLKKTQDELEQYREKYHEADKNHAVQVGKNKAIALHEILKFLISVGSGGFGVGLFLEGYKLYGGIAVGAGIILYIIIVLFDNK